MSIEDKAKLPIEIKRLEAKILNSERGFVNFTRKHGTVRHYVANPELDFGNGNIYLVCHLISDGIRQEKQVRFDAMRIKYEPETKQYKSGDVS